MNVAASRTSSVEAPDVGPMQVGPYAPGSSMVAGWQRRLRQWPWLPFAGPLLVYSLLGVFEPPPAELATRPGKSQTDHRGSGERQAEVNVHSYPRFYITRLALTLLTCALVGWPAYRSFSSRISVWGVISGVIGGALWIGLVQLGWEDHLARIPGLAAILGLGQRPAFDPLAAYDGQAVALSVFLAVRFLGLVAVIPLIEEFFLRGFLMRYVIRAEWSEVPFGSLTPLAVFTGTMYGVLSHPAECLAAAAWFSLGHLLMAKTRSLWDCVLAHAVTNLLLGLYVVLWRDWAMW